MQKSYTRPNKPDNRLKLVISIIITVFLILVLFGARQLLNEIRMISEGQQILILKLTEPERKKVDEETEENGDEYVSRIEYVKFKNETNKTIKDLTREISMIQTKLKMKRISLDRN
ncbi:hypothetical protein KJ966_01085 [bacterium]|nr:hypothetical protein [bacterium]